VDAGFPPARSLADRDSFRFDASAGEARSEKIMLKQQPKAKQRFKLKLFRLRTRRRINQPSGLARTGICTIASNRRSRVRINHAARRAKPSASRHEILGSSGGY
jgi:hypothetical protein